MKNHKLFEKAKFVRLAILDAIASAGKGHIGGAFSCADILVSLYYGGLLQYRAADPQWEGRDRFILSKGHSAVALYAVLADLGFFDPAELHRFNDGSLLGEHPDRNIPGIEITSGSLGHGLGIGSGMAYAAKMDNRKFKTYVLLGDGECHEGSVWEAAMFAAHHDLDNLVAIVDRNRLCIHGTTEEINRLEPLAGKFSAFGWDTEVIDGHNFEQIAAAASATGLKKPKIVIANTIKGKGVSFMENKASWHHGRIAGDTYENAKKEMVNS